MDENFIYERLGKIHATTEATHKELEVINRRQLAIEHRISNLESWKNRILGAAAAVSTLVSLAWAYLQGKTH